MDIDLNIKDLDANKAQFVLRFAQQNTEDMIKMLFPEKVKELLGTDNKEASKPVTIVRSQEDNTPIGVRVRTLDEDFVLALHDIKKDGVREDMTWDAMMERIKGGEFNTFTKKQASIICAYKDDIDKAMEEVGGEKMSGWYWSVHEYYGYGAWCYGSHSGCLRHCHDKFSDFTVRPLLALPIINH